MRDSFFKLTVLVLVVLVALRGLTMEMTDLIDPTESRYAFVADEMLQSGDWITPKLPMPEGVVPYLGKPPLHFWATALSYKLFGVDEWSSRLPSFIFGGLLLISVVVFGSLLFSKEVGLLAAVITFTSGVFYFFSGASAVDLTLTFFVVNGVFLSAIYLFIYRSINVIILLSACCALGFLTKGPIAIALVLLPVAFWIIYKREWRLLSPKNLIVSYLIFFAVAAPWFIYSEFKNPGFLKYFFWNENMARYLTRDYGDKYGSGHVFPYGTGWGMFLLGFMPWSPLLLFVLIKNKLRSELVRSVSMSEAQLFLFISASCTLLFFTFIRQLHSAYLLPVIPLVAILVANFLLQTKLFDNCKWQKAMERVVVFATIVIGIVGCVLGADWRIVLPLIATLIAAFIAISRYFTCIAGECQRFSSWLRPGALSGLMFFATVVALSPHINYRRSTEGILKYIVANAPESNPIIGVLTQNTFSHYWLSRAWQNELGEPISVVYVDSVNPRQLTRHLLVSEKDQRAIEFANHNGYRQRQLINRWFWFERIEPQGKTSVGKL